MTDPRKKISIPVWKELFARSGNLCAYAGCPIQLFDKDGVNDVYIAHINGVGQNAPRHDPNLTITQRDGVDNLLLLCNRHHNAIDVLPVTTWTVEAVRKLKHDHEARMAELSGQMRQRVTDTAFVVTHAAPAYMTAFLDSAYGAGDAEDDVQIRADIAMKTISFIAAVQQLPQHAREVFAVAVARAEPAKIHIGDRPLEIDIDALEAHIGTNDLKMLKVLENSKFGSFTQGYDGETIEAFRPRFSPTGSSADDDVVAYVKDFAVAQGIPLERFFVDGRWDLLDTGSDSDTSDAARSPAAEA